MQRTVPSRSLLRFLKCQSDAAFPVHQPRRPGISSSLCRACPRAKPALGGFSTSARRRSFEKKTHEPTWQERLWGTSVKKRGKLLKADDLPPRDEYEHGSSMFTSRRVLSAKAALEPRLRCTEVDENGKVILVDGEFKKTELIAKVYIREDIECAFASRPSI